jgi:protoporphyrin/coproporphyrin ferrochelatase
VIDAAHASNVPSIAVVPVGFVTDHLETLFDLDIEAAGHTLDHDMDFARGPVANDHEHLIKGLAEAIRPLL